MAELSGRVNGIERKTRPGVHQNQAPVKIGLYVLAVWAVLTINFLLPRLLPGDPLMGLVEPGSNLYIYDADLRARQSSYYGLDRPLYEQYFRYLAGAATGNLGWSIHMNAPVAKLIRTRLPWTLLLVIPSLVISSIIAVLAGAHSAWMRGSLVDRLLLLTFTALRTLPIYFLGILLLVLFCVNLGWFPLGGSVTPFRNWPNLWLQALDVLHHLVLPTLVLVIEMLGGRYLLMRNSMVMVLGEDYMLVGRAKGLPERSLKYRYGVRNAILPFITASAAQLGFAVAGAIFVETLFAYPGMGRLVFEAVNMRDYPVLEGSFLVIAISVLTINLATDLLYARLDPRVRQP